MITSERGIVGLSVWFIGFVGDPDGSLHCAEVGVAAAGAEPLLRRHTNLTPWNRDSWKRVIAAAHAASVR